MLLTGSLCTAAKKLKGVGEMRVIKTLIEFVSLILFILGTNIGVLALVVGWAMLLEKAESARNFESFFLLCLSFPFALLTFGAIVSCVFDKLSSKKW